jgi:hypothetical protein
MLGPCSRDYYMLVLGDLSRTNVGAVVLIRLVYELVSSSQPPFSWLSVGSMRADKFVLRRMNLVVQVVRTCKERRFMVDTSVPQVARLEGVT